MHPAARHFIRQWLAVAGASALVVIASAFLFVPPSLGQVPGHAAAGAERHMT